MNTTIRTLVVALPLAAAAMTVGAGAATADGIPSGPGTITAPTPGPVGPGDIANPEPGPSHPTGPGDLTAPQPCPTHGVVCGGGSGGSDQGGNGGSGDHQGGGQGSHHGRPAGHQTTVSSIALPTRIDAGLAPAANRDGGMELTWLLAGGGVVTASGAAFVARRKAASRA